MKAKRGKTEGAQSPVHVHVGAGSVGEPPAEPEASPETDALDEALAQLPDNVVAKLYRIREDGRKAFVMEGAPTALSESRIAKYGAGDYVVVFWGPLGDGSKRNGYRGSRRVYVAETDGAPTPTPAPSPNGGSPLDAAVATMLTSMITQQQAAAQQQAESSRAMNALMLTMMKDHSTMLAAQLQALTKPATDPLDTAERLTKILQPAPRGNFGDFLKDYAAFKELTGEGGGGGNGDEHWAAAIAREVAPYLLGGKRDESAAPAPAPAPIPAPVPEPRIERIEARPQPVAVHPEPEPMPNDLLPFAELLPKLRTARAIGLSPQVVSDAILDATDDDDALEALLERPGLVADIHRQAPDIPTPWLDEIRSLTLNALRESVGADGADDGRLDDDPAAPTG